MDFTITLPQCCHLVKPWLSTIIQGHQSVWKETLIAVMISLTIAITMATLTTHQVATILMPKSVWISSVEIALFLPHPLPCPTRWPTPKHQVITHIQYSTVSITIVFSLPLPVMQLLLVTITYPYNWLIGTFLTDIRPIDILAAPSGRATLKVRQVWWTKKWNYPQTKTLTNAFRRWQEDPFL